VLGEPKQAAQPGDDNSNIAPKPAAASGEQQPTSHDHHDLLQSD
jgi:hypothetical protein